LIAQKRKKDPKVIFSTTYKIPLNPVNLYLERETRLASGLRAVEIYGFSIIPETGIALILDSFRTTGKERNYRARWLLIPAGFSIGVNVLAGAGSFAGDTTLHLANRVPIY
jgi:hypothetical protein